MLKEIISPTGSMLPQVALLLFFAIALFVLIYIATDRRRDHRKRMESMPLDDGTPTTKNPSTTSLKDDV